MLKSFTVSGFNLFDQPVTLDLVASKGKNTVSLGDSNILKSSILYGANNSGKSSFIEAIAVMAALFESGELKAFPFEQYHNFFTPNEPIAFETTFVLDGHEYTYGLQIPDMDHLVEYLDIDKKTVLDRGPGRDDFLDMKHFPETVFQSTFGALNPDELFMSKASNYSKKIRNIHADNILHFFNSMRIYDNNERGILVDLMIACLEDPDKLARYNAMIAKADLSLIRKELTDSTDYPAETEASLLKSMKKDKMSQKSIEDVMKYLRIKSVYKHGETSKSVPSELFDSVGTSKFSTLLLLVMDAIEHGRIMIIDEIDNSLHFKLTRELITLMNSPMNTGAQFIMSAHDIKLLTPMLFRKEQVNFLERTEDRVEMFSLGDFDEVRNDSSFENLYTKDKVGALPKPDFNEVIKAWDDSGRTENHEG
jgi:uncharacterized protein